MKKLSLMLTAFLTILFLVLAPLSAFADTLLTQMGGNPVVVPEGQIIENVLAVDSDARVSGTVNDLVLVINGDVYLEPTSHVNLVIDLGGNVHNLSLQPAENGIFEFTFTLQLINHFLIAGAMLAGFWFIRLMGSLLGILLLTCLGFLLKNYLSLFLRQSEELLASSATRLFGIGAAITLVLFALMILLSFTVVGIPLALLIFIVSLLSVIFGIVPIMDYLGNKWLSGRISDFPVLTNLLIEAILFVAVVNLPLFGFLFLTVSGIMGLGLVLTQIWMLFKKRRKLGKE
ncbi:MAG: hypothetical protein P4L49_12945 [Desulfosporosinus sp.]|nr:hypothetical protein [Desulfosporosinus sp.]